MRYLPLAPMSASIAAITIVLFLLPPIMALSPLTRPVAVFIVALYAVTALGLRPRGFEVEPGRIVVRFPLWSREINHITHGEIIDAAAFRSRYGRMIRVGVGGLFGAFGWLWGSGGTVEMYLSRSDGLVLFHRADGLPLLITPEDPGAALRAVCPGEPPHGSTT